MIKKKARLPREHNAYPQHSTRFSFVQALLLSNQHIIERQSVINGVVFTAHIFCNLLEPLLFLLKQL